MRIIEKMNNKALALGICVLGRALDFSTTWVGLEKSIAEEIKPVASHAVQMIGNYGGIIGYETLITTPFIFLGCKLINNKLRSDQKKASMVENMFLYGIGTVSLITASHNLQYILR